MTVRVGFAGTGAISRYHAGSVLGSDADVTLSGAFDVMPEAAASFATHFETKACPSVDELLEISDAIYVCTWTSAHAELVAAAAARGLAVFCEKPLAVDLPNAVAMTNAVRTAGVVNQVGLILRAAPVVRALRELSQDPASGPMLAISSTVDMENRAHLRGGWRGDAQRAGGGILLELAFHDLDVVEWIAGPATSVSARMARDDSGLEDACALLLTFDSGAIGTLVGAWHDAKGRGLPRRTEVVCDRAGFTLDGNSLRSTIALQDGEIERRWPLSNPDADFIRCVIAGEPASPNFEDALRVHELIDAAYRSAAADGAPVPTSPRSPARP